MTQDSSPANESSESGRHDAGPGDNLRAPLPFLTPDPGIGGRIKAEPEDFEVEEIPAYLPGGEGEHLFLWIEKRDVPAESLTRHVARTLGIAASDVGVAGLKDRRAVTRQWISVPARAVADVEALNTAEIRVLDSRRHANKLRTGHLKGNRFSVLVRGAAADRLAAAEATAAELSRQGFPNYYGDQRFGRDDNTLELGLALLRGQRSPGSLGRRRKFLLRLALGSVQSHLFNQALSARAADGLLHRVLAGDVMQVVASGGVFEVTDPPREQERFDQHETVITGPMFGPKMRAPGGEPLKREQDLLSASDLGSDDFARFKKLTSGTRRPYLIWPGEIEVTAEEAGLRFRFELPSGCYATTLLREFVR